MVAGSNLIYLRLLNCIVHYVEKLRGTITRGNAKWSSVSKDKAVDQ